MDSRNCADESVIVPLRDIESMGNKQYKQFCEDVFIELKVFMILLNAIQLQFLVNRNQKRKRKGSAKKSEFNSKNTNELEGFFM